MEKQHNYAITKSFIKLNNDNKKSFLLLTKLIIELQTKNNFNLLNLQNSLSLDILRNYPYFEFNNNNYYIIFQLYQNYNLFSEIIKLTNNITKNNKLNLLFNKYIENTKEKEYFLKFINVIVLINLIKKQLINKSRQEIEEYNLLYELNNIHPNIIGYLNLSQLHNLNTIEQFMDYFINTYNYNNISINTLIDEINDECYDKLYNLFSLFI